MLVDRRKELTRTQRSKVYPLIAPTLRLLGKSGSAERSCVLLDDRFVGSVYGVPTSEMVDGRSVCRPDRGTPARSGVHRQSPGRPAGPGSRGASCIGTWCSCIPAVHGPVWLPLNLSRC